MTTMESKIQTMAFNVELMKDLGGATKILQFLSKQNEASQIKDIMMEFNK